MVLIMRCKRCSRVLKNKKSIDIGYGTSCFKKMNEEKINQKSIMEYMEE